LYIPRCLHEVRGTPLDFRQAIFGPVKLRTETETRGACGKPGRHIRRTYPADRIHVHLAR
jgi:hypothetical protein